MRTAITNIGTIVSGDWTALLAANVTAMVDHLLASCEVRRCLSYRIAHFPRRSRCE